MGNSQIQPKPINGEHDSTKLTIVEDISIKSPSDIESRRSKDNNWMAPSQPLSPLQICGNIICRIFGLLLALGLGAFIIALFYSMIAHPESFAKAQKRRMGMSG